MKKIEILFTVLTEENGIETIAALSNNGLILQAVSSDMKIIQMAYAKLKELCPNKTFWIQEFTSK